MNIPLNPDISTLDLGVGDRALGRILQMDVGADNLTPTEQDLGGDIFHSLFSEHATRDPLPSERAINGHLLDWLKQSAHWPDLAADARGNIASSLLGGEMLHRLLRQDGPMQEALKRQQAAADRQAEAEQAQQMADYLADQHAPADQVDAARAQAQQAADAAQNAQADATGYWSRLSQNNLSRALAGNMVRDAAKEAQRVAGCFSGWGHGPGSPLALNPRAALDFMRAHTGKIERIAHLAGRLRGIGFDARRQQVVMGTVPNGLELTKDVNLILPSELAQLSPAADPYVRLLALARLGQYGMLGRHLDAVKQEQGPFVYGADVSGSMHGEREIAAKAVGLGLAQVAKADERVYNLFSFSSSHDQFVRCASTDDWQTHLHWAAATIHGGTSFDVAILEIINLLRAMGEQGHNADGVISSDGEAVVSPDVVATWRAFQQETGARLLYVQVAQGYGSLEQLADKVLHVPDLLAGSDEVMRIASTWLR